MLDAAASIRSKARDIQFLVASANQSSDQVIKPIAGDNSKIVTGATYDAVRAADAAAVTSGTATLETAILGTPMAIVYATSALNYTLLRPLISVEHFGLVNLIAGERLAKEMIQRDFTSSSLADELMRLLDPEVNSSMREKLRSTTDKLGHGGASKRAAEAISNLLRN
jgi:lipid-A-disaccharide synthase